MSAAGKGATSTAMGRWLWLALPLATAAIYAVWGGLMNMIVARQIAEAISEPRAAAGTLGRVMTLGASVALVAQPLLGSLSDRTRGGRLGRRNLWILGGSLASAAILAAMAANREVGTLTILFPLVVLTLSGAHAALTTVLPERVPEALQGKMSGICGSMTMLGVLVGVSMTGLSGSTRAGYLALAAVIAIAGPLFALTTRDMPGEAAAPGRARRSAGLLRDLPGFSRHRDFWWTFVSRFALLLGYNVVMGFNLFLLRDHVGFGGGDVALVAREAAKVVSLNTAMLLIFSLLGGVLCDATGRVRPFVICSAFALVPAAGGFALLRSLEGYYAAQAIMGAAFGIYMAVDAVLIARVLPRSGNEARDLGILNIANSGPQALAPVLAGAIVAGTGNYALLFVLLALSAAGSAVAARQIKSVC